MKDGPNIAGVAALLGDPARANMLTALMGGQALTAGELAREAGVMPQTASGHLAQLLDGGLLLVAQQGRHRYFRLAGPEVAEAIEALMEMADGVARRVRPGPRDPAMRTARVCYDHLAGARGVALFRRLCDSGTIALDGTGIAVTERGVAALDRFGIDVAALRRNRRPLCRSCLDWSERTPHLAGALGASLLEKFFEQNWANRVPGSRVVSFTNSGEIALVGFLSQENG